MPKPEVKSLKSIRPGAIPFWMLNDASTPAEKVAYLRACRAGGFEAVAMHPRSGNLIPYASREWFEMIAVLVEAGRGLDMDIWLYDEDPYPSGAAGGLVMAQRPDLKARSMSWVQCPAACKPGSLWRISEHPVLWAGLVAQRSPRDARDLTDQVGPVRNEWFMSEWDSRHYYDETPLAPCPRGNAVGQGYALRVPEIPSGYRLAAVTLAPLGVEGPWGCLPDLLNPDAFDLFKSLVLDRYHDTVGAHYGKTIPGIFTDEAKPHGNWPVTPALWTDFKSQFGYDLLPRIYRLFGDPLDREDTQVRLDYRRWVSQRFMDAFVLPYRRYCDQVGLRLVGHFSPEDDPIAEALSVISVMPVMQAMSGPGTDIIIPQVGDDTAPTLNLGSLRASSVRARYGAGFCISETLALSDWTATTWKSRQILAWQKVLGIDRFFLHGFYTSSEGVQNYEAPPDYGPNSSIFAGMGVLNDWLKRLEPCMDGADESAPVAILNSLYSFWTGAGSKTPRLLQMRTALWQTLLNALSAQVGIHLIDETEFAEVRVEDGLFQVGARRYRMLLAPDIDILGQPAYEAMQRLDQAGIRVVHFGGGAAELLPAVGPLRPCEALPGECRREAWPSLAWCRRELPRQMRVSGPAAGHLFVRRFRDRQDRDCLLAVNLKETEQVFRLRSVESDQVWQAVEVDGDVLPGRTDTRWTVPGGGCGLFALPSPGVTRGQSSGTAVAPESATGCLPALPSISAAAESRPLSRRDLSFRPLDLNTARLSRVKVFRPDVRTGLTLPYPRPYWRCFEDYRSRRALNTFRGPMPLESEPAVDSLTYRFDFTLSNDFDAPLTLVLDPRCARGRCAIALNGVVLRRAQVFPLEGIRALRLPLRRALRPGANRLELTFALDSALDGLLSQVALEGQFDLSLAGEALRLSAPQGRSEAAGWQRAGLPHYMGRGRYDWTETLSEADLASGARWMLELDQVVDSAACRVNGRPLGARAWKPWRWLLPKLKVGDNRFELVVSGTAGNRHALTWPDQPQGWLGAGRLVRA